MGIRYVHTNIIAKDWRALAAFYTTVFSCKLVPPERDLSGGWMDDLTGICGAHVTGRAPHAAGQRRHAGDILLRTAGAGRLAAGQPAGLWAHRVPRGRCGGGFGQRHGARRAAGGRCGTPYYGRRGHPDRGLCVRSGGQRDRAAKLEQVSYANQSSSSSSTVPATSIAPSFNSTTSESS